MKLRFHGPVVKATLLFIAVAILQCCSDTPDDAKVRPKGNGAGGQIDSTATVDSVLVDSLVTNTSSVFTVIGDVPYNEEQRDGLISMIDAHNTKSDSEFIVHVGDIKPGASPCDEALFKDVNELLGRFKTPTFIVLGDNEYNDCDNPEGALALWNKYFLQFNENWGFPHKLEYQKKRPENFAWVENSILFVGLNLVGSAVHDQAEWNKRLADDADWIEQQFELQQDNIQTAVFFGHANMNDVEPEKFESFTDRFRAAAQTFGKPVLYLQGDGHFWLKNRPWPEQNILRVQIEGGANAVQVRVDPSLENPFLFDQKFLD